jgi:hypothetical protein
MSEKRTWKSGPVSIRMTCSEHDTVFVVQLGEAKAWVSLRQGPLARHALPAEDGAPAPLVYYQFVRAARRALNGDER